MATYTITVDDMKDNAAELVRAVHEQQIEYVILQGGAPVALLSPGTIAALRPETTSVAAELAILDAWLDEGDEDEIPYDDFLAFIEQHRLDLHTEP